HHSPLFSPAKGYEGSADHAFKILTQQRGVPPEKINLGAAFYGRTVKFRETSPELFVRNETKQSDEKTFPEDEGFPMYYNIVLKKDRFQFIEKWDSIAKASYM